jgi:hypothetical protein
LIPPPSTSEFGFALEGIEPTKDIAWQLAGEAGQLRFWNHAADIGLVIRRASLASGIDLNGRRMVKLSPLTRRDRKQNKNSVTGKPPYSPMGRADPAYAPLQSTGGLSRTQTLLRAKVTKGGVWFFWADDPHTGRNWGAILARHARGFTQKFHRGWGYVPSRNVLGFPPADVRKIQAEMATWWLTERLRYAILTKITAPRGTYVRVTGGIVHVDRMNGNRIPDGQGSGFGHRISDRAARRMAAAGNIPPQPPPALPAPAPNKPTKPKPPVKPAAVAKIPVAKPAKLPAASPPPTPPSQAVTVPILPGRPIAERIAAYKDGDRKATEILAIAERVDKASKALAEAVLAAAKADRAFVDAWSRAGSPLEALADLAKAAAVAARTHALATMKQASDDAAKVFAVRDADRIQVQPIPPTKLKPKKDPALRGSAQEVLDKLTKMVSSPGKSLDVEWKMAKQERAYHQAIHTLAGRRQSQVALRATIQPDVIAHELGHALEWQIEGIHDRVIEFARHRFGSEAAVSLRKLFPGHGFTVAEMGRKDHFDRLFSGSSAYYVGKTYAQNSEVISMGIQKLFSDPAGFATKDREFFKFILGILDGSLR